MNAKGKILVVDDDRLVLATLTHGLAQAGYEVIDADNGDDAILLAREHRPDLALLDIRMEGKSGFDVADYLRDYCHMPFMFLSAFADARHGGPGGGAGRGGLPGQAARRRPDRADGRGRVRAAAQPARAGRGAGAGMAAQPAARASADVVAMAVGVLMHRYSLSRGEALERLQRMADAAGVPLAEQAERLVRAVEELARPGAPDRPEPRCTRRGAPGLSVK